MGLSGPGQSPESGQSAFSEDILKIELSGPQRDHLTVIDVPGIFRTPTVGITTKKDMSLVRRIVHSYIKDENTIILAVVPAPVDIATQEILSMAEEVDAAGVRTLGVLTKPDLVDKGGEHNVIDLVQDKRNRLLLGYCIVKNRSQQEIALKSTDRDRSEAEFFSNSPWDCLAKDRVGISALKERLRVLLMDLTRKVFPLIKAKLGERLAAGENELAALGQDRTTNRNQHRYLQGLATEFQRVTDLALRGDYGHHELFNQCPKLRLPTLVVRLFEQLSREVAHNGISVRFRDPTGSKEQEDPTSPSPSPSPIMLANVFNVLGDGGVKDSQESREASIVDESPSAGSLNRMYDLPDISDYSELSGVLTGASKPAASKSTGILEWIKDQYKASRGFELASFNPTVLAGLWKSQSWKWEPITFGHIDDVILVVHRFVVDLLNLICPDKRVCSSLLAVLEDELRERYRAAIDHAKFIIRVERSGTLMTMNHYLSDNLEKARRERVKASMLPHATRSHPPIDPDEKSTMVVPLDSIVHKTSSIGNTEHTVQEIHDILKSYYKVARKRFVDNICTQASDYHLVTGPSSPLRVFTPEFVAGLSTEQLEWVAGEDSGTRRRRETLQHEIKCMREARKVLMV